MTKTAQALDYAEDTGAKITPDQIERAQLLVGYDEASSMRQQSTTACEDSIRAFALSYGDDNPLFCDPGYAETTRWGGMIGPPTLTVIMGKPLRGDPRPEHIARAKRHLLQGIHQMHSATEWNWYRPIRQGDTIYRFGGQEKLEVKKSEFAGTALFRTSRDVLMNQNAEVVCIYRWLIVHSERSTAAKRGKYKDIQPTIYSDEDIAKIDAIYAAEQVRGAEPRYWEDVQVGDSLGVMAKGPLTVTDIICMHTTGFAVSPFGIATGRVAYKRRQKMPRAFIKNAAGIPDTVMRMHWDDDWAKALGTPWAYDYGVQRECWLSQYLTDWSGDEGILLHMRSEMRKFNCIGDSQTITGEVVDKQMKDGHATVEVKVRFINQRGDTTLDGSGTIALPSREHGQAQYPNPPADIAARAKAFLERHHELSGGRAVG